MSYLSSDIVLNSDTVEGFGEGGGSDVSMIAPATRVPDIVEGFRYSLVEVQIQFRVEELQSYLNSDTVVRQGSGFWVQGLQSSVVSQPRYSLLSLRFRRRGSEVSKSTKSTKINDDRPGDAARGLIPEKKYWFIAFPEPKVLAQMRYNYGAPIALRLWWGLGCRQHDSSRVDDGHP